LNVCRRDRLLLMLYPINQEERVTHVSGFGPHEGLTNQSSRRLKAAVDFCVRPKNKKD
jgi:hypothetical protein